MNVFPIRSLTYLLLMVIVFLTGCTPDGNNLAIETSQRAVTMSRTVELEMDYLFYLPEGYGKEDHAWPLMIFLHFLVSGNQFSILHHMQDGN